MGLRDNFRQAAKELIDGPEARRPRSYEPPPAPEPPPVYPPEPEAFPGYTPPDPMDSAPEEPEKFTTIIAPGTVIRGSVDSDCDVEVYGEVQGDITTTQDLRLKGKIKGNATGENVDLAGTHIVGNIAASGAATMDAASEVEGDVTAQSMVLDGKIWGMSRWPTAWPWRATPSSAATCPPTSWLWTRVRSFRATFLSARPCCPPDGRNPVRIHNS